VSHLEILWKKILWGIAWLNRVRTAFLTRCPMFQKPICLLWTGSIAVLLIRPFVSCKKSGRSRAGISLAWTMPVPERVPENLGV